MYNQKQQYANKNKLKGIYIYTLYNKDQLKQKEKQWKLKKSFKTLQKQMKTNQNTDQCQWILIICLLSYVGTSDRKETTYYCYFCHTVPENMWNMWISICCRFFSSWRQLLEIFWKCSFFAMTSINWINSAAHDFGWGLMFLQHFFIVSICLMRHI